MKDDEESRIEEALRDRPGDPDELVEPCEKCGRPNFDAADWKWCAECRRKLAQALTGIKVASVSRDQVESKRGGWLETKR